MDEETEPLRDFLDEQRNHMYMIKEMACHAGYLDAVRELIAGRQWIVL